MTRVVTVVIPTLNEAARIGGLLAQLSRQPSEIVAEILVADGGSTDATRALVSAATVLDPRIRLIDNPERIQAAGVNRAVDAADARADTIVRIDAHAIYPDDYVPRIVEAFAATGAEMVAVRLDTRGVTCLQRGIAAASNSRIGSGGSAHRTGGRSSFVDHGHHAGMDRATFTRIGGYDTRFDANEDAELDYRVRQVGGRVWLAADIEVIYFPRTTLAALFRQYYRYGRGRARTFLKHGERLRVRQMLPPMMVAATIVAIILAPLVPALLIVPLVYALALAAAAVAMLRSLPQACTLLAAPAMATMHFAWGIGFVKTVVAAKLLGGNDTSPRRKATTTTGTSKQASGK